jgi:hypothetical protein
MKTSTPTVTIVCPDWCTVDPQEHADELGGWEGRVMHRGPWVMDSYVAQTTDPECRPAPWDGEPVIGIFDGRWVRRPEEVEALANKMLEQVDLVRRELRRIER